MADMKPNEAIPIKTIVQIFATHNELQTARLENSDDPINGVQRTILRVTISTANLLLNQLLKAHYWDTKQKGTTK